MKLLFGCIVLVVCLGSPIFTVSFAAQYYVSPTGLDTNSGTTIDSAFQTVAKAISIVAAGDTIYVRGGVYTISTKITISKIGNSVNRYYLFAYPGERPILDFSSMAFGSSNQGIQLKGSYWYIKGLDIKGAGDNGLLIDGGKNNIVENCAFYENQDSGCQLKGTAANNQIINCDSYYNYDAPNAGGNADGFSPKQLTGINNYFYGCRSWQNSDDGWDCYEAVSSVTIENCWTFSNGYLKDGSLSPGNGNGFKLGGNYTENNAVVKNCLAFNNKSKGFDQNHNRGSMTLFNCTGYGNDGKNYSISEALDSGKTLTLTNCVEYGGKRSIGSFAVLTTNCWMPPFVAATSADFVSLDTSGVRGPRKADGSLPDITFMHLAPSSQFVNRGTDVGLPYIGTAPDLGCFETSVLTEVADKNNSPVPKAFSLYQNYPNPFNPSTEIRYSVSAVSVVHLSIYNILGQEVAILVNEQLQPGNYSLQWNASRMSSGLYFIRLSAQTTTRQSFLQTRKIVLTK
jgi:hypothetical protein